jgi:SOS-response transcriptional repressor LexA
MRECLLSWPPQSIAGHLFSVALPDQSAPDERAQGVPPPGLPVIGAVAAGSPLLAVENQRGTLPMGPELFSPRADYLLQVRGNRVELIAENLDYAPIVVNGPLMIEGLVVGLIRGGQPL